MLSKFYSSIQKLNIEITQLMPPRVNREIANGGGVSKNRPVAMTPTKKALIARLLRDHQPESETFTAVKILQLADEAVGQGDHSLDSVNNSTLNSSIKSIRNLMKDDSK